MKYRPFQPKRNVNISDKHPLKEFAALLSGLLILLLLIYVLLGFLIDITVSNISTETELAIYDTLQLSEFSQVLSNNPDTSSDTFSLLQSLLSCTDLPYPIQLSIEDNKLVNAMALPGGYMNINQGLLDSINTENGLAFVLAHELAHFKNRDHLRSMGRGIVLLAGSVLLTGTNSDLSQVLTPAINLQLAQYSQKAESQADKIALEILHCRYGSIEGATELFEHLQETEEDNLQFTHYFSSHPQTEKRIEQIRASTF